MEIEWIARKLEPIKPAVVEAWRRNRDFADPELKALLDRHLIDAAYRHLGDFRSQILLSIPPSGKARGRWKLGTVRFLNDRHVFGLRDTDLLAHTGIFGRSGSGKTNLAYLLLQQLTKRNVPWLLMDWKRNGRSLIPLLGRKVRVYTPGRTLSPFVFNPLAAPPALEEHLYANQIVDILAAAYGVGEGAQRILQAALMDAYRSGNMSPTAGDLIQQVQSLQSKGRRAGWVSSALRVLESLDFAKLTMSPRDQRATADELLRSQTIVELDGLDEGAKRTLIPALSLWLYQMRLAARARESLEFVLLLEEAHHVLRRSAGGGESTMERLVRLYRELGVGLVILDQSPSLTSSVVTANTFTSVFFNLKAPADLRVASAICKIDPKDNRYLTQLPVGQAIVALQDRWTKPVLLQIPHCRAPKGSVTDEMVAGLMEGRLTLSGIRKALGAGSPAEGHSRSQDLPLSEADLRFIRDIIRYPYVGVDERYRRLRWSADKGTRVKRELLANDWIEEERVPRGRTRRSVLRLTKKGRHVFAPVAPKTATQESITHQYWKHHWRMLLNEKRFATRIEAPRFGGFVDVLARRGNMTIGIEIETGKSDYIRNLRNCLRSEFSRVVLVASDSTVAKIMEKKLAREGFLIPERVEVVVADELPTWLS